MGLFDELDIAGAADNPWVIPDNTYPAVVTDLEVKPDKNENMAMIFHYKITDGEHTGFEITEYKRLPSSRDKTPRTEAEKAKDMSYIKQRLASLDIPESRMNDVTKEDIVGIECYVSTRVRNDFVGVRSVTTKAPESAASSGGAFDAFTV